MTISLPYYTPLNSRFCGATEDGKYITVGKEYSCREEFIYYADGPQELMFYYCLQNQKENILRFFEYVEKKLKESGHNIKKLEFIDNEYGFLIRLSPWWRNNYYRKSIFTLFLRIGHYFDDKEDLAAAYSKTVYANNYDKNRVLPLIEKFFEGYTKFIDAEVFRSGYANGFLCFANYRDVEISLAQLEKGKK